MGRSFETLTVPNLKFTNYDSACERSYCCVDLFYMAAKKAGRMSISYVKREVMVLKILSKRQGDGNFNMVFSYMAQCAVFDLN